MIKAELERLVEEKDARIRALEAENFRLQGKLELLQEMQQGVPAGGQYLDENLARAQAALDAGDDDTPPVPGAVKRSELENFINDVYLSESSMSWRPPGYEEKEADDRDEQ